jgi:hypothetical protein
MFEATNNSVNGVRGVNGVNGSLDGFPPKMIPNLPLTSWSEGEKTQGIFQQFIRLVFQNQLLNFLFRNFLPNPQTGLDQCFRIQAKAKFPINKNIKPVGLLFLRFDGSD